MFFVRDVVESRGSFQLKGKAGNRGWSMLPPDLLTIIFTEHIRDVNSWSVPTSWSHELCWANRLILTALHVAHCIEPYMGTCRSWRTILSNHPFWAHACALLDPTGQVAIWRKTHAYTGNSSASFDIRYNHQHYHIIKSYTCMPCRMSSPFSRDGFVQLKRLCFSLYSGTVGLCRDHKPDAICGACLRADRPEEEAYDFIVCRSEDEESFPNIEATCGRCRRDAVYRCTRKDRVLSIVWDQMATARGTVDWEIRQAIDQYIEYGEGTLARIVSVAWEKTWLRRFTKIAEYLDQAVASVRYQNREEGYDSDDEISDDEDVLCFQEEAGVKDIAMSDYCRGRIVDGHWCLPYDMFLALSKHHELPIIPAFNPVPYVFPAKPGESHPNQRNVESMAPPTHELAQQLSYVFQQEMRKVLDPALRNLVRKLVIECTMTRTEPGALAYSMEAEDILQGLRTAGVWWDDFNWVAKWEEDEKRERMAALQRERGEEEESNSSSSDYSSTSQRTSPVLSTSTLQTTPSPPPVDGTFQDKDKSSHHPILDPPSRPPSMLRIVPFVPESSAVMPFHTRELLKNLWREACAPLFHCKCSVCTRAMLAEKSNSAAQAAAEMINISPVPIAIDAFQDELDDPELQEAIAFERQLNSHTVPSHKIELRSASPPLTQPTRKRSSEELDEDERCENNGENLSLGVIRFDHDMEVSSAEDHHQVKRIKLSYEPASQILPSNKRSSEEMESGESTPIGYPAISCKRARSGDFQMTPRSLSRHGSFPENDADVDIDQTMKSVVPGI